jgi:hypothetical protein
MRRQGRNANALTTKRTKQTKRKIREAKKNLATHISLSFISSVSWLKNPSYFLGALGVLGG